MREILLHFAKSGNKQNYEPVAGSVSIDKLRMDTYFLEYHNSVS